jgi:hypothetical protein
LTTVPFGSSTLSARKRKNFVSTRYSELRIRQGRRPLPLIATGILPRSAEEEDTATTSSHGDRTIDKIHIGQFYDTTYGTLWKDGTYFPRGSRVQITGLHIEQGFCVRFPAEVDGEPLETWEDWDELDFLAEEGSVESGSALPGNILLEAREVLDDAEDGCHLHLHEDD